MKSRKKSDAGCRDAIVYGEGICYANVCTRLSLVSTTKWMNDRYWAGTHDLWKVESAIPCDVYRGRRHVKYVC